MKKISLFFRKVLIKIIEFYQKHISKVLAHGGINCKFYPTCSEYAKQAIDKTDDINVVKDSFNLLYNQHFDNLSKLGLEVIDAKDKEFDPSLHEAVMQTPTNEHPENHVIMELQKGYKYGDKVLRPTLVNVATSEG